MPRKNLIDMDGKPLIAWTVEAAKRCPMLDEVYISTDDREIADVAVRFGARFEGMRPDALANDVAPMLAVVQHFIDAIGAADDTVVVLLQPTSPFRTADDISSALELFYRSQARALISVVASESHPEWAVRLDSEKRVTPYFPAQEKATRRQDMAAAYRPNGAIYLARASSLRAGETWYGSNTVAYEMPRERSLDIDEPWDVELARAVILTRKAGLDT